MRQQAVADQVQAIAESPAGTVSEKVGEAQKLVMSLSDSASLSEREPQRVVDLMPTYLSMVEERWERRGGGLDTGFPDLDRRLNGGMADGNFVVLAARPAMGKTALALQIAEHFASSGRTALVLSQEMQSTQLIDRTAAFVGRVGLTKILTGEGMTADDHDRFFGAIAKINDLPLVLDEQGALRIEDVRRKARRVKSRHGLSLIVIDYLQLMAGDGENRTREITQITAALKALAKELGVPVLALSQLNRGVEQRPNKRPVMADLRESGSIEQDADVIMALYRDEYYNSDSPAAGLAELLILKNRQGASGGFVPLVYQGECTRFDSMFGQWPERQEADAPKKRSRGFGG
ncbi:MAG: replicative DNA helicase [Proteobacteria bacterium]|nr:replicative DNA helicase [Pseudomonadota bacterium]